MESELLKLLEALEEIGKVHPSVFDSSVRQAMGDSLVDGLARMKPEYVVPGAFGLTTPEADNLVHSAISHYLDMARPLTIREGLTTFYARLAAIQNDSVRTDEGNDFEEFFGYTDPRCYDEEGGVIRFI
jgi:hypothetical protein